MEHEGSRQPSDCRAFSLSQHASQISSRAAASTIPVTSAAVQANSRMSSRTPPYPSTHNLGTCRMSENSRDGVCNKFGQTHDVRNLFISDGSQFTTGGAENPTLTIVSLAIRQAEYIADEMGKKNI